MPTPDWNATRPDEMLRRVKQRGNYLRTRRHVAVLTVAIAMVAITASAAAITGGAGSRTSLLAGEGETGRSESIDNAEGEPTTTTSTTTDAGGPGADEGDRAERGDTTSTTSTTITGGGSSVTTTTAPRTTTTAAGEAALAFRHPREGAYRYRVTKSDGSEEEMRKTYQVLRRNEAEVRLRETRPGPAQDPFGGADIELSWQRDRVLVVNGDSCDEQPMENAVTRYRFPMPIGAAWSWDATCSNEDMGVVRRRGSARVTGQTTQRIGGRTVDVRVISAACTVEITVRGVTQTNFVEFTEHFAPDHGLQTRTESRTRPTRERTGTESGPVVTELLRLDPE